MSGRRDSATESRILQGRDARSVRVLVPDCRGLEQNLHDVTVVNMCDLPESEVSIPVVGAGTQMVSGSDYAHEVATSRVGVETGSQGTLPEETAGGV